MYFINMSTYKKLNFKLIASTCNYMKHFFNKQLTSYLKKIIVVSKVFLYIILQNNIIFIYNLSLINYLILSSFFQILYILCQIWENKR